MIGSYSADHREKGELGVVHVRIKELLEEQGRTKYWLNKRTDIDYKALCRLMDDETTSIHFDTMEKLCTVLKCTPNELFDIIPTEIE